MLTGAQKKYLFAIYTLGQNSGQVRSSEVSELMGVSKASTVKMTRRLCEEGCILKEHYGRIQLTPEGVREASSLYTKCLVIGDFLKNRVGVSDANADLDAVQAVVCMTDETIEKLLSYALGG